MEKIIKSISSCLTYEQLETVKNWVNSLTLDKKTMADLSKRISEKEEALKLNWGE